MEGHNNRSQALSMELPDLGVCHFVSWRIKRHQFLDLIKPLYYYISCPLYSPPPPPLDSSHNITLFYLLNWRTTKRLRQHRYAVRCN